MDPLMVMLRERAAAAGGGPEPSTALVALIGRLPGQSMTAIGALERIAADESESPWTRDAARELSKRLGRGS